MPDLVTFGETMLRLSPPPGERLATTDSLDLRVAGAESNVAVAARRLGADAVWLSKLPDSPLGRRVVTELRQHGIEPAVAWSDDARQGAYYIEQGSRPRGTDVIYDRADAAVTTATVGDLDADRVREADGFYTSGITPALSPTLTETTRELLATARDAGTLTAFDVNYRSKLWSPAEARETLADLFPLVDVVVVAERDAERVLDCDGSPEATARDLAAEYGFETVVVTRGDRGSVALHDGALHEQPAVDAETVDPIGTGDAFVGAFLATLLAGEPVPAALEYGAATASLKRTMAGDMVVCTREEIERVVEDADRDISR